MRPPSMVSLYGKSRDRAQQIRFRAVAGQVLDCLVDQETGLLARPLLSEERYEGGLALVGISPRRLARRRLITAVIDEVVGDLERQADVARVAAIGRSGLGRQLRHDARRFNRIFDQRAG